MTQSTEPTVASHSSPWWRRWDGLPPSLERRLSGSRQFTRSWPYYFLVTAWAWFAVLERLLDSSENDSLRFWLAVATLVIGTPLFLFERRRARK